MRVEARTLQAALKSYGFAGDADAPIVLDGVIGPVTRYALQRFDEWVEFEEGGDLWGDYAIIPTTDNRAADITPDSAAQRFISRGTAYMAAHPEEVVFRERRTSSGGASAPAPITPATSSGLALPFWRSSNLLAWVFGLFGLGALGATSFLLTRKLRGR